MAISLSTEQLFQGTAISPSELVDLAVLATAPGQASDAHRCHEVANLREWCDDDVALVRHAASLARGRGARPEVVAVLEQLADQVTPGEGEGRLAATG